MRGLFIIGFTGYIGTNISRLVRSEGLDRCFKVGGFNRDGYTRNINDRHQQDLDVKGALSDFAKDIEDLCILNLAGTTSKSHSSTAIAEYKTINKAVSAFVKSDWLDLSCRSCLYILPNSVGIFGLNESDVNFGIKSELRPYNSYTEVKADEFEWCQKNSEGLMDSGIFLHFPIITNVYGGLSSPSTLLHGKVLASLKNGEVVTVYNCNALRDFVNIDSVGEYLVRVIKDFLLSAKVPSSPTGFLGSGVIRSVASFLESEFPSQLEQIRFVPSANPLHSCPSPSDRLWFEK